MSNTVREVNALHKMSRLVRGALSRTKHGRKFVGDVFSRQRARSKGLWKKLPKKKLAALAAATIGGRAAYKYLSGRKTSHKTKKSHMSKKRSRRTHRRSKRSRGSKRRSRRSKRRPHRAHRSRRFGNPQIIKHFFGAMPTTMAIMGNYPGNQMSAFQSVTGIPGQQMADHMAGVNPRNVDNFFSPVTAAAYGFNGN